jgi:hypothetical protein
MTQFTPERLARTNFLRLIRTNSEAARERLMALIADPEALALYADSLASRDDLGLRTAAPRDWDALRRRILTEGLRGPTVDEETLAWLALDFDALAELQFDLYSIDDPAQAWRRALESGVVGSECLGIGETDQVDGPLVDTGVLEGILGDYVPTPGAQAADPKPEHECDIGATARVESILTPPPLNDPTVGESDITGGWREAAWECRLNFQRCLVDRRGWLHWSNHTIEDATNGHRIVLFVHHDTMVDPALTPHDIDIDVDFDWVWATVGASSAVCLHALDPEQSWPKDPLAILTARIPVNSHIRRRSWSRWFRTCVPFLRSRSTACKGAAHGPPPEGIAHLGNVLSTLDQHWNEDDLASLVIVVDAALEITLGDAIRAAYLGTGDWSGRRAGYLPAGKSCLASGRILLPQLPGPKSARYPRREFTSMV